MSATLVRIAGPVAVAVGLDAKMYDVVHVGKERLLGEVIQIIGDRTVIQVYEDTTGITPGEPVEGTGSPLSVELGPGLLASIYDGIQRPLEGLMRSSGNFISRGLRLPGLDPARKWTFMPSVKDGAAVTAGMVLGTVEEVPGFTHKVLVPPGVEGKVAGIKKGAFTVVQPLCTVGTQKVTMRQQWAVRVPRPFAQKHAPHEPLITGQRVIDALFPIAKGGSAIIPGPFGAGKTVTQQQLAKWSDADIIVYVGCGERGNEMTEVLTTFPELQDPRNGRPLLNRTVLIANTSNMPVAAREASIYTGITIAEYFRDMGYHVAVMADSTSRWAEALREISSRLEEMPGEEGFPAYLASRIAEFYERSGPISAPAGDGSVSIIGAVSPPGGDFLEPVVQSSLRVAKAFWGLDAKLAQQRHFPSVNWLESYSLYHQALAPWYKKNVAEDWSALITRTSAVLQEESELLELVQLVGADSLPEGQQLTLHVARILRETVLQQSAYDDVDAASPLEKTYLLAHIVHAYHALCAAALARGVHIARIEELGLAARIYACKNTKEYRPAVRGLEQEMTASINALGGVR